MQQVRSGNQGSGMLTLASFEWFKDRDAAIATFLYNFFFPELTRVICGMAAAYPRIFGEF